MLKAITHFSYGHPILLIQNLSCGVTQVNQKCDSKIWNRF